MRFRVDPWAHALLNAVVRAFARLQRCCAACSGRRVQSRLVFKDGHPHLVGLPRPVPNRSCRGEPTVSPRHARFGGHATAKQLRTEPLTRRRHRRSTLVPRLSAARQESSRPSCGETGWCPDSGASSATAPLRCENCIVAFARPRTRRRPMTSAILTTHGHV